MYVNIPFDGDYGRPVANALFPQHTDLSPVRGRRVLALLDDDNIRFSLKAHYRRLDHFALLCRLRAETIRLAAHSVLTYWPGDEGHRRYVEQSGFRVLAVAREEVQTRDGIEVKGNADMDLCLECGRLFAPAETDTVLLGSGDGDLCIAAARGVRRVAPGCRIVILSVRPNTSSRLIQRTDLFDRLIFIGSDLAR